MSKKRDDSNDVKSSQMRIDFELSNWGAFQLTLVRMTPGWVKKRVLLDLQDLASEPVPLMDPRLVSFLMTMWAGENNSVIEFGAGYSSLFFSKKAGWDLLSIEHDEEWYKSLSQLFKKSGNRNLENLFYSQVKIDPRLPGYKAWGPDFESQWDSYIEAGLPGVPAGKSLDLVISDGGARKQVLLRYFPMVASHGALLFHDASIDEIRKLPPLSAAIDWSGYYISNKSHSECLFRGADFTIFFRSEKERNRANSLLEDMETASRKQFGPLGDREAGVVHGSI